MLIKYKYNLYHIEDQMNNIELILIGQIVLSIQLYNLSIIFKIRFNLILKMCLYLIRRAIRYNE